MNNNVNKGIKRKDGSYILKSDPDFFEQYLQEYPEVKAAFESKEIIVTGNKSNKDKYKIFLLSFIFLILSINLNTLNYNNNYDNQSNVQNINKLKNNLNNNEKNKRYTFNNLKYMVVDSAVKNYKKERGIYPYENMLIGKPPENWLSFIPNNLEYNHHSNSKNYGITPIEYTTCDVTCNQVLELHFYPKTNQLGVSYGDELLALYTVASGKLEMPFIESEVLYRVVNPNGGNGVLGTRGLVIGDNYAIHGTNDINSIGNKVSMGCIRLFQSDIEIVYPYISKGTPFKVKPGFPSKPMFAMGLPPLDGDENFENEETPDKIYKWKN